MKGYNGKIIKVDLSKKTIDIENPDDAFYRKFMGGACMGTYLVSKHMDPRLDAFDSDSVIAVATSVLTGIPIGGLSRHAIVAKSPLTDGIFSSEAGGYWGAELKFAGYDAIVIKGKAPHPVNLWITNDSIKLCEADQLWGLETADTLEAIRSTLGDNKIKSLVIGPAGENLVRFANINNDLRHWNGRGGLGAVMGSKNLKAISVRGKGKVTVHDPEEVKKFAKKIGKNWNTNAGNTYLHDHGSSAFISFQNGDGQLPTHNFKTGIFDQGDNISGDTIKKTPLFKGSSTCFACPIRCKKDVASESPIRIDGKYGGPEYESLAALGAYTAVGEMYTVVKACELCNRFGMDTVSAGGTIAFAMECAANGLLKNYDADGLNIDFGENSALTELIRKIAYREDIGDLLAEGALRASKMLGGGAESFAVHAKGLELPAHDPRVKQGYALSYATHPNGADHMGLLGDSNVTPGSDTFEDLRAIGIFNPMEMDDLTENKIRYVYYGQIAASMVDSLCVCMYCILPFYFSYNDLEEMVQAATGWNVTLWELMKVGERRLTMARLFNQKAGVDITQDTLAMRMFEPIASGPRKGAKVDQKQLNFAIKLLYGMFGWDKNGVPTRSKTVELDIANLS